MSTTYVDRGGYEWEKHCATCHQFDIRNKHHGDRSYCRAFRQDYLEEPFRSYEKLPPGQNTCPHYLRTDRD